VASDVTCTQLSPEDWKRYRDIRLASLLENPEAFGGKFDDEKLFDEERWLLDFAKHSVLVASLDGIDAALMFIENLDGDFGATCWVGGCWSDPKYRGTGLMRAMFNFLDSHAKQNGWEIQGLGVWKDNFSAIAAYEKLGFIAMGDPQPSSRQPGKFYQRMIRKTSEG
jgi:GNAT superfamily N-acetyltransferase